MADTSPGRELAIETLIDMEPEGAFYRAARVLEEAVPSALSSRPNLITRSALVEQAHALRDYEVDSVEKYNALYGHEPSPPRGEIRNVDRILRHHGKLARSPTRPQLVSALRNVCGDSSDILRSLLRRVMTHKAIGDEDENLEAMIGNVCRLAATSDENEEMLHGLLICSLSILTGSILSAEEEELKGSLKKTCSTRGDYLDPVMPALQVGSVLSLLQCKDNTSSIFHLDEEILEYLGKAASVHEERIEIACAKSPSSATLDRPLSPIPIAPLTPPVLSEYEEADESDSTDESDDRFNPGPLPDDDVEIHQEDSSSSSSDSEGDPQHVEIDDEEEEDEEGSEVEEDDMLREALTLSLVEQGPLFAQQAAEIPRDDNDQQEQETTGEEKADATDQSTSGSPPPLVQANAALSDEEEDESPLPPLPPPPPQYPYAALIDSLSDLDGDRAKDASSHEELSAYLDPAELSKFGSVPSANALVHILRYIMITVQRRREVTKTKENAARSIPGGMGSSLFEPRLLPYDSKGERREDSDHAVSIQLLMSTFLIMDRNRRHAIDNLREAISAEQRNLQGEDEENEEEDSPLSAEDDPALALAMNYVEDDVYMEDDLPPSSDTAQSTMSESLENKGMRRKAAAAAHDAAARLKSLRKQTEAWRQRVKLLSQCTLMSMQCLREYLRSTVSQWLKRTSSLTSNTRSEPSLVDFHHFLPSAMVSKLSEALTSLMSVGHYRLYASLLSGDDSSELEDVFFPLQLYREALCTWGECIPVLHPSAMGRSEILTSTMDICIAVAGTLSSDLDSLETLPTSDTEVQLYKLQILCRRLCVSDLLNGLVARPACYTEDDTEAKVGLFGEGDAESVESCQFNKLIKLIGSTSTVCQQEARDDLERIYLALCHRCNVQVLLWDGLFACSQVEREDIVASSPAAALSGAELIRVNPSPSSNLHFDPTKCSDSIAILSTDSPSSVGGPSVHQRASKVWGAVLSSSFYSPKTGVHRWALRLDKCERGHVFVGVATAQASTRTYVGGDKFGWGVIGTQALWHDRRKIRGDYGATFRTGSTIVVTLDTDAGTLSFSSWKDFSSSSTSFSLDPSLQSGSSPTRRLAGGGTMEDWGVAFEGLPLDSRLYPAVGLYQRDDRVTLLNVESGGRTTGRDGVLDGDISGGLCYYPSVPKSVADAKADASRIAHVRRHNDILSWDGILYVTDFLRSLSASLCSAEGPSNALLSSVLPSIAAALSLIPPSIPMLSQRFGVMVLPHLSRCIQELHTTMKKCRPLFSSGLQEGKWIIRATGSSGAAGSTECEEYVVDFLTAMDAGGLPIGFHGSGVGTTGKSKNGLVSIMGAMSGSALHFIEEWTDGNADDETNSSDASTSSCVVAARMNFDGSRFEGTYRNVQYGTAGQIAGFLSPPTSLQDDKYRDLKDISLKCEALMCLAQGHLASILAEDIAGDHVCKADLHQPERVSSVEWVNQCLALKEWVQSPLLANGLIDPDEFFSQSLVTLRQLYASPLSGEISSGIEAQSLLRLDIPAEARASDGPPANLAELVDKIDNELTARGGGKGSLVSLCPSAYSASRRSIICALVYHGNLYDYVVRLSENADVMEVVCEDLIIMWRISLRIMDDNIRSALSTSQDTRRTRREICLDTCGNIDRISNFLLAMRADRHAVLNELVPHFAPFYATIGSAEDLLYLEGEMECSTKRALLRMSALQEVALVLTKLEESGEAGLEESIAVECITEGLTRLMGRVWSKIDCSRCDSIGRDDISGYYLAQLSGAASFPVESLREILSKIYCSLSRLLKHHTNGQEMTGLATNSMVLSILAANMVNIRAGDVPIAIAMGGILADLPGILAAHREAILTTRVDLAAEFDTVAIIREICDVVKRDASRAVLLATVSVVHVMTFQLTQHIAQTPKARASNDLVKTLSVCLELVFGELGVLIPLIESVMQKESRNFATLLAEEEWKRWCGTCLPGGYCSSRTSADGHLTRKPGKAVITYLNENGVGSTSMRNQPPSPKPTTRTESLTPSLDRPIARSHYLSGVLRFSCQQYLSQWLNVLACLVKTPPSLQLLSDDWQSANVLITAIGLCCARNKDGIVTSAAVRDDAMGTLLPTRHRARILRLLRGLLAHTAPNEKLVEGLLSLAGATNSASSQTVDSDDNLASRETVSLLRHLHLPAFASWRACVHAVISRQLDKENGSDTSSHVALGIRVFLGGSIGALKRGAYVLLKPSAAASLSPDAQASPSSKSHSSSGNNGSPSGMGISPHHVAGNGTEGIVSGLCRSEAAAGIVSSVLVKNGACEVILMNRHRLPPEGDEDGTVSLEMADKGSISSRHSLTVRALRTPLSDVALAEEVPLLLDPALRVENLLGISLPSSLDDLGAGKPISSSGGSDEGASPISNSKDNRDTGSVADADPRELGASLITLRSAVTLTSNQELLQMFLKSDSSAEALARVLRFAHGDYKDGELLVKDALLSESLSDIPKHEAQYTHLLAVLREVKFRSTVLDGIPISFWEKQIAEQNAARETAGPEKSKDSIEAETGGTSTPPVDVGLTSAAHSPLASAPARNLGDEEGRSRSSDRVVSQSTVSSNSTVDDEDGEAAATAAAHLREAAIAQMAELGLPRSWSELALRRTGGTNIEAAVHFCLERGEEMERLLAEEHERERMMRRQQSSGGPASRRRIGRGENTNNLLRQLLEMGFPSRWCAEALAATGNNVDEALTWILTNGERLSAEDLGMEGDLDDGEDIDDDEESAEEEDEERHSILETVPDESNEVPSSGEQRSDPASASTSGADKTSIATGVKSASEQTSTEPIGWSGSVAPLRFISGRSIINSKTLAVSGLPAGGFSSVGTKGVLLTTGKWYYEAILETAGCLQIGWADGSFSGHCNADRGDGCGDGPSSWAYDGWRRYRWHASATEWGCRWIEGDVVGCLVDLDDRVVSFTLNGQAEDIGMGVAFSGQGFRPCGGVYACVSFNRREKLRMILGGKCSEPFKHKPPLGYKGVGEAVLHAVEEHDKLLMKEKILHPTNAATSSDDNSNSKRFLCDFSDGEHGHELFAWQHRYYGSDASVHLGSARHSKQQTEAQKSSSGSTFSEELLALASVSRRVEKAWAGKGELGSERLTTELAADLQTFVSKVKDGYAKVAKKVNTELRAESVALGILYCRKLILHLMVTLGKDFNLGHFIPIHNNQDNNSELSAAKYLWSVLDSCVSLRSAGWIGEAGAMAVAAEALGLGISSVHSRRSSSDVRAGVLSVGESDSAVLLPSASTSQVLSTALTSSMYNGKATSSSLGACAEAAIGGGGSLVFLQPSLQSLVSRSSVFQDLLVAVVRRSVRLLAGVDYAGDDSPSSESLEDDDMDVSPSSFERSRVREPQSDGDQINSEQPDARLTLFFTGLLLSRPVSIGPARKKIVMKSLFEAWSVGLLSGSAPWRMVCALSAAGILNIFPEALLPTIESLPTVSRFYARLQSTVVRRVWAERAAVPVCSRYAQALIDLLSSVRRALQLVQPNFPRAFCPEQLWVDAATPIPFNGITPLTKKLSHGTSSPVISSWEWDDGWLLSDAGWEVWTGSVECMAVDWKAPSRSAVRTLMDGGEGPPMLRVGCRVMRGLDWDEDVSGNEDGKDVYEAEKAKREKEKSSLEERDAESEFHTASAQTESNQTDSGAVDADPTVDRPVDESIGQPPSPEHRTVGTDTSVSQAPGSKKKNRRKIPNPKLPVGTVLSVEPWQGMPAMARRVKWDLTGLEGVYSYGGEGGRYDISHVDVNDKSTRVKKRHPYPESAEQCAFRHGFGVSRKYSVLLRVRRRGEERVVDGVTEYHQQGILEWPDFGAGIRVDCILHSDGAVSITENELLYGSKDSGWEARFGQPSYVPGTVMVLSPTGSLRSQAELDASSSFLSLYEELLGSSSFSVEALRNRANGNRIRVTSEMQLLRSRQMSGGATAQPLGSIQPQAPAPICFDRNLHAPSISLSRDGRTVTCVAPDGRGTAFASVGFTKGVHYWEVKLEQADIGSVFIGVAEKPAAGGSGGSPFGQESQPRLNRWHGWGFVNFRATYSAGAERVYGAHCHAGDSVGVLLDCDAGRVSFFFDGLKYGEHILHDLGCAFENISPFGFNADGCGSGGAGQGAPSGIEGGRGGRYPAQGYVRPRALWPVVGLRNPGDRVTLSAKWMTSAGVDGSASLKNILAVDELLSTYDEMAKMTLPQTNEPTDLFPSWFVKEAFTEYERWRSGRWLRSVTRGSGAYRMTSFGLDVDLDASPLACASACAGLGLKHALLSGDRVVVKRSAGRMLELAEEAVVLGAHQGRLFYRIVSQKSEGGSLTEGGGRAWFWDESEVVDNGIDLIGKGKGMGISLPIIDRFKCLSAGGLKIVYDGGAVVRSDLEIFDGSANIGSLSLGTVIPQKDVLERRVNSCGVVRYRIRFGDITNGWISGWIRGGKEDAIVEPVHEKASGDDPSSEGASSARYATPLECAQAWHEEYSKQQASQSITTEWKIEDLEEFKTLLFQGVIPGKSTGESDCLLVSAVGAIADFSEGGDAVDCTFDDIAAPLALAVSSSCEVPTETVVKHAYGVSRASQAAMVLLSTLNVPLPSTKALLARTAMLRAFNRRARLALPWLSVRPSQEGNAIFGGLCGHGASIDRVGRYREPNSLGLWVQVPSIGSRVRAFRHLFFTCVKRSLLESITESTTTPTPLSHDEYELPREIRTVRINRLKARRAMASADNRSKRKHSVFSQLQSETRSWGGAALRRGFVAKGHGGQKRAFKVKLIGEGVNDYSGPYREAFTDAMHEIVEVDGKGRGALGVLDATPNNFSEIGDNRELFMFSTGDRDLASVNGSPSTISEEEARIRNSFSSLTLTRDEVSREVEESLVFLGRLVGTACRHGIPVDLPLPMNAVWRALAEEKSDEVECLRELDFLASRQLSRVKPMILQWQHRMLNSFMDGLSNVLPVEVLTLMTGEEIRDLFCGNADVDVDLLRRVVEYEGYKEDDEIIRFFWEALREMSSEQRKKFLQFVWARNRLPMKESAFEAPFKIQKDTASAAVSADAALPSASTCFFSLTLPEYSSKDILKRKLLFAIENVFTMESDYVTNDAEVGEGWRGL